MADHLLVEVRNQIAIVTLNRPEVRNAFDGALIASLTEAFREIDGDDAVRAMVLASAGTAFCAGADLNGMRQSAGHSHDQHVQEARALAEMLQTLDRMKKPTVARVHGPAYGGGVGLVAACDIAIGAHQAEFCLSEVKLGLSPAIISPYVVRAMGERLARRYFLTGESIDAGEAYRLRLLSDVSPKEELDGAINAILGHLVTGGREAHASIKDLVRTVAAQALDDALIEDTAQRIAKGRSSAEGKEGVSAFLEKRKPAWVTQFEAVRVKPPRRKKT
jgi:methylglutaconyl-CoA hydratase